MTAAETFEFDKRGLTIESAVFQALGAASVCWENLHGTGVFQDGRGVVVSNGSEGTPDLMAALLDSLHHYVSHRQPDFPIERADDRFELDCLAEDEAADDAE